ncbi:hypothetical protein LZ198_17885 [Myxococcus sp. K15C18031901]|uniref:hypothetical protein n=1 Tax=Myxococcus dinghuensis TaxID=2906761 RepID=UPI0020A7CA95|nr:hypothetical protein [Myxococcus dinghuensis]MCP3100743.1 hypothetical protein [Myxococcus dinghuensis]
MNTRPLKESLPDEHILQVEPRPRPSVDADWRSRPHLYNGRALSEEALDSEQRQRAGRLALRGQMRAPGVIAGLEVRLEQEEASTPGGAPTFLLRISAGMGLLATGEDVVMPRAARIRVDRLLAYWQQRPEGPVDFDVSILSDRAEADIPKTHADLRAAVLVLVPLETHRQAPPAADVDPCEATPEDAAFEDEQLVDGCAVVLYAWPPHWPLPEKDDQWRNRLAWELFERERLRPHGEHAPWEEVGVPLALIGFDPPEEEGPPATPLFIDRAAVVRTGGAPRARTPLLPSQGTPLLWQARMQQLSEHLAAFAPEDVEDGTATLALDQLPPVGMLPRNALSVELGEVGVARRFFPESFELEFVPVPLEQLDGVAQASASLAPLSTSRSERVRVLVPVPEAHFQPQLLRRQEVGPEFQDAIEAALARLGEWLRRREDLRGKATLLLNALEGRKTKAERYPEPDPQRVPGEEPRPKPDPNPYGPEEADYGIVSNSVPALDEVLPPQGENSLWGTPALLGFDAEEVSTAMSTASGADRFGLAARQGGDTLALTSFSDTWQPWETLVGTLGDTTQTLRGFRVVWNDRDPAVVVLVSEPGPPPPPGGPSLTPDTWFARVYHHTAGSNWRWEETQRTQATDISDFTAVCWGEGRIDVFAAATTTVDSVTAHRILAFTWVDERKEQPPVVALTQMTDREVFSMKALQREEANNTRRIDLLLLAKKDDDGDGEPAWLHHLSGVHEAGNSMLTDITLVEVNSATGNLLAACRSSKDVLDVLVMGPALITHGRFQADWTFDETAVSTVDGSSSLQVVSRLDGQLHAFWRAMPDATTLLLYAWFDGDKWHPARTLSQEPLPSAGAVFDAAISGGTPEVFLATLKGLQHLKMLPDGTRALVEEQGLRGTLAQTRSLLNRVDDLIQAGSSQLQADTQNVRQLMLGGSTEASRLVVSPILGATMVQSPLSARADIEHYFNRFLKRRFVPEVEDPSSKEDARETLVQATLTRASLTRRLVELVKELQLDVTGMNLSGIALYDSSATPPRVFFVSGTRAVSRESIPLDTLVKSPDALTSVLQRLTAEPDGIEATLKVPPVRTWTPNEYFTTAVQHLEDMLVLLRELERRTRPFANAVAGYEAALARIEQDWAALSKRLGVVDAEVAEGRQDVTVARALKAEEQIRVHDINERRQEVLDQHVPFFVYQRPRQCDLTSDAPSRLLDPGFVPDILPQVLASTAAAPPELLAFVELVRDSPLRWFTLAPRLLDGLDRIGLIHRTFEWAQVRAVQRVPIQYPVVTSRASSPYVKSLSTLLAVREDLIARQRVAFVGLQPALLQERTWLELQQSAREQLSLGDLIDTAHGRSDVGRNASSELEDLAKVATGLYQRFGEVLPALRLEWAERMSQYDTPVDLRDLSRLPGWSTVDVVERRGLQRLTDWLYQRVVSTEPEAVSLISDLVRVCMLLASHAPVNELLSGHVSKPTEARVGGSIELAVDPSRVRVGMHVTIRSGERTVQAVVEDLTTSAVRARVVLTSAPVVSLQVKTSAYFSEPARGTGALLPYVGVWR